MTTESSLIITELCHVTMYDVYLMTSDDNEMVSDDFRTMSVYYWVISDDNWMEFDVCLLSGVSWLCNDVWQ